MSYRVVWFKRDLRLQDHAALAEAAKQGPVLCLYIVEPGYWALPDVALQHFEFVRESLLELDRELQAWGGRLEVRCGSAEDVLTTLYAQAPFIALLVLPLRMSWLMLLTLLMLMLLMRLWVSGCCCAWCF
jgi:deoxyribodipyrimidine photo-lyase